MKLQPDKQQIIEIQGNDTVFVSDFGKLSLFIFDEGKGALSDKTDILSYHEHSIVIVRSVKEMIISNDLNKTVCVRYIPVNEQIITPDPQYLRLLDILKKLPDSITILPIEEDMFTDIRYYCLLIERESSRNRPYSQRFINLLESSICGYVARYLLISWQIKYPESISIDPAEKMHSLIDTHFEMPLSLSYFSDEIGLTSQHLSKIFKEKYGISYIDYLNKVRIEHAKQFLSDTNELITDIALDVGFNNSTHFCTTFKKLTGLSPNKYRKINRKRIIMDTD